MMFKKLHKKFIKNTSNYILNERIYQATTLLKLEKFFKKRTLWWRIETISLIDLFQNIRSRLVIVM